MPHGQPWTLKNFLPKLIVGPSCWEWNGAEDGRGYGATSYRGKSMRAHRVSWSLHYYDIPPGRDVMHLCDNPLCCRPTHLRLGTHAENMADMAVKGRSRSRITRTRIQGICAALNSGEGQVSVARRFKVSRAVVVDIARGKTWSWLTGGSARIRRPGRGRKKLTPEKVADIRAGLARGDKRAALAKRHGVHVSMISNIVRGKQWSRP